MLKNIFLWLSFFLLMNSSVTIIEAKSLSQRAYQYSTIQALMQGVYDGELTLAQLKQQGNFGVGTFNSVDGEMISLDGQFFRIKSDGSVQQASGEEYTPFAIVTYFQPEHFFPLGQIANLHSLEAILEKKVKAQPNNFWFVRIDGFFPSMKTRSIAKQTKPYQPLAKVIKKQDVFSYRNITGTLVGVYTPAYAARFNTAGFHFHFISNDRKSGGHVLEMTLQHATVSLDSTPAITIEIPQNELFQNADLNQ